MKNIVEHQKSVLISSVLLTLQKNAVVQNNIKLFALRLD